MRSHGAVPFENKRRSTWLSFCIYILSSWGLCRAESRRRPGMTETIAFARGSPIETVFLCSFVPALWDQGTSHSLEEIRRLSASHVSFDAGRVFSPNLAAFFARRHLFVEPCTLSARGGQPYSFIPAESSVTRQGNPDGIGPLAPGSARMGSSLKPTRSSPLWAHHSILQSPLQRKVAQRAMKATASKNTKQKSDVLVQ